MAMTSNVQDAPAADTASTSSSGTPPKTTAAKSPKKKKHPLEHFLAGGAAGLAESSVCHPLDTIKTRMQLRRNLPKIVGTIPVGGGRTIPATRAQAAGASGGGSGTAGPLDTARRIVRREGFTALYKGLTAVYSGIVPKMAIRFWSFEQYKELLGDRAGLGRGEGTVFLAGTLSGLTEAVLVVTPAEVCKIRMQAQYHSMVDPRQLATRKYTNVVQTALTVVREEGASALYKGIVPTMLRQGCNQAANFTTYNYAKRHWEEASGKSLVSWQHMLLGCFSGGVGPCINNPLDVVKTRLQRQVVEPGVPPKYAGLFRSCAIIVQEEGAMCLYKGLTPRLMRIMPGQGITFATYEYISDQLHIAGIV